ncbi:hypothetical protein KFE25_001524 [Diacronema lutheri]|uniref:Uncharacterized protein n=1 Tax=Diacronema lutheri TaxID=2081491 RepID=A0A8J5X8A1_DIALT|nr:hypothetical protein KFE25_001524 [Diacronema lutheri]
MLALHRPLHYAHALVTVAAVAILLAACVAQYCLSSRRRRRRIPFIFQDHEEVRKNPSRLSSAVGRAAAAGDMRVVTQWLDAAGKGAVNAQTSQGRTALHCAASEGQGAIMRALLDAGADVHTLDNALQTALHIVAAHGHGTCVKMLLDAGADPTVTDSRGDSPLALAERGGRVGTVRLMRLHLQHARSLCGPTGGPSSPAIVRHR